MVDLDAAVRLPVVRFFRDRLKVELVMQPADEWVIQRNDVVDHMWNPRLE